jgi:UDP-glucose 4-epimerase
MAGFLGSHLADKFLTEGWEVAGIDNLLGGYRSNVPKGVSFHNLDLVHDQDALSAVFDGAELVVHAACTAYEGLSVFSPSLVVSNTVQATTNAVTEAVKAGAKKFVQLSSMARYGDHDGEIFEEWFEPRPQDPYGIAKLAAEKLVQNICDTHGLDWTIIVPHNIIGSRQKFDDPYRNVASIMTNRMLQGKQPIIYGDGTQQRYFTFFQDVVEPLWKAISTPAASRQVINVGQDDESLTINELAEIIADILGFDLAPIYMEGRPQEVPIALCSSDKARELLGYQTSVTVREGLEELVGWIQSQGAREFDYHLPLEIINDKVPKTWSKKLI